MVAVHADTIMPVENKVMLFGFWITRKELDVGFLLLDSSCYEKLVFSNDASVLSHEVAS